MSALREITDSLAHRDWYQEAYDRNALLGGMDDFEDRATRCVGSPLRFAPKPDLTRGTGMGAWIDALLEGRPVSWLRNRPVLNHKIEEAA